VLVAGMACIIGTENARLRVSRQAKITAPPAEPATEVGKRLGLIMIVAAAFLIGVVVAWTDGGELRPGSTPNLNYQASAMQATLKTKQLCRVSRHSNSLRQKNRRTALLDPLQKRADEIPDALRLDDMIPDHGHVCNSVHSSYAGYASFGSAPGCNRPE